MLRLVLLVLYLTASYLGSTIDIGGGWDPDGRDSGGGLDPNGLTAPPPPTVDIGGGLDPNG